MIGMAKAQLCAPVQQACAFQAKMMLEIRRRTQLRQAWRPPRIRQRREVLARDAPSASQMRVKLLMASTSDKLDLSECELSSVPEEVFALHNLKDLSLAGNSISELPAAIGQLTALERLVIAGNDLESLPSELTQLPNLKGMWGHGNRLARLPEDWAQLQHLEVLSLAGNALERVPESMGALEQLRDLNLAGNCIASLPDTFGGLHNLSKLHLHGNLLDSLPASLGSLPKLVELKAMGNRLTSLPSAILASTSLELLNLADNQLAEVPDDWSAMRKLRAVWLYGNALQRLPTSLAQLPALKSAWLEGNPCGSEAAAALIAAAGDSSSLARIGLDTEQVCPEWVQQQDGVPVLAAAAGAAAGRVKLGVIRGAGGRGYFKVQPGPGFGGGPAATLADGSSKQRAVVVAFGSAPGDPNWGGLLSRLKAACKEDSHRQYDILFVVDATRSWYNGGDGHLQYWHARLAEAVAGYSSVLMIGDSMGATAALLFSPLATSVLAFTPQVDLTASSIRPGKTTDWRAALKSKLLASVTSSTADIQVHTGTWAHDLEQANLLPTPRVSINVHYLDSHRLAAFLDAEGKLLDIVHDALAREMGYTTEHMVAQQASDEVVKAKKKVRFVNLL